jgi:ParB family transcriptional regulator, chromosome partitioning protein
VVKTVTPLQELNPDSIRKNPDNPRLIFQEDEMNDLLESIREVGIKVPVSVYSDGNKYTLLDGERRWRCAKKLNLTVVPAIVQPKPTRLENLLMMFNIHNVRVDWDLMPMALKLGDVRDMLEKQGQDTSPKALAAVTGVRLPTVRRALDLLDLPTKYQRMLLKEAEKPRNDQKVKADLFIEIYKSMHAVERYIPSVFEQVTKPAYVDAMVKKYVGGVVDNVVAFREVSKIARAERAGGDKDRALPTIVKLVKDSTYSIDQAFEDTVQAAYEQRDLLTRIRGIISKLGEYKTAKRLSSDVRSALDDLRTEINRVLR